MSDDTWTSKECADGDVASRTGCILSYDDIEKKNKLRRFAIGSLLFVIAFQIGICLLVYCSGISIVWCAMGGWIVSERKRLRLYDTQTAGGDLFRRFSVPAEMSVVFVDIAVIIYYAFVSPILTTVAHVMSLVLGATLSLISIKRYDEDHGEQIGEPTATPATPLMT